MSQPSLPLVNLWSLTLGTLFYGMYFIVFIASMYIFLVRPRDVKGSSPPPFRSMMFLSGCALFIAVTANWVLTVVRGFQGFIYFQDGLGAHIFFNDNSQLTETLQNAFVGLSIVLGDLMIIYRLWVVWSFNKLVVVLPLLCIIGLTVAMIFVVVVTVHLSTIAEDIVITPLTSLTIATNVYCTLFLAWKIWKITKMCRPTGGISLWNFLAIIVESAALYTSWILYYTITHQLNLTVQFIAIGPTPAIIGLANALIHVRVGLGRTIEQVYGARLSEASVGTIKFAHSSDPTGERSQASQVDFNMESLKGPSRYV
ncbi:hypothetical protein C8J57DRAFT_1718686 [Mycena rebaudengoi]|nr:hypothetical protein C8J57DRAFT_1718686 [Mycena rebaudengoi]